MRLYRAMWEHAEGSRGVLVAFLSLLLLAQACRLLIPYFFGEAVNALQRQGAQDLRAAAYDIAGMVACALVGWALHGPARIMERFTALRIRESFADQLFRKSISLDLRWHEAHHSGETIHRMSKATVALHSFSQQQFIYLQSLVNLVGPFIALLMLSVPTGLCALAGYSVAAIILLRLDGVMIRLAREENRLERRYSAALVDYLGNVATVLTLRLQDATRRLVGARLAEVSAPVRRSIVVNEVKWGSVDLLNTAVRSGLVIVYAALVYRATGSVLVGTAVMVYQYSQQIGNVVGTMAGHWADLVRYQTDIAAADDILTADTRRPPAPRRALSDWREIRVEGLRFSHPRGAEGAPTLDDVSLVLRRGARIALVGESGSGKSSLLRVLAGLHPAERARFVVDGRPSEGLADLGGIAVLVPQEPEVFESTLEHNVTMGLPCEPEALRRACDIARLTTVAQGFPEGMSTQVSERGSNLSGGQRQRLALARGLLAARGASLVMLDEPTSSVDPVTEAAIYARLLDELGDACVVSAVHRLHLLPRFDTVVLLAGGRVVTAGTAAELLACEPRFQAMWRGYVAPSDASTLAGQAPGEGAAAA